MKCRSRRTTLLAVTAITAFTFASLPSTSSAGLITVNAIESGGDVIFSGSGTFDLTGLSFNGNFPGDPGINPQDYFNLGGPVASASYYTGTFSGPTSFGTVNSDFAATSSTGDFISFEFNLAKAFAVPLGYVSNDPLSSTATFAGATFSSLQITPGSYSWTLGSNQIELNVGAVSGVPEPSSLLLTMTLGVLFGLWHCKQLLARTVVLPITVRRV